MLEKHKQAYNLVGISVGWSPFVFRSYYSKRRRNDNAYSEYRFYFHSSFLRTILGNYGCNYVDVL